MILVIFGTNMNVILKTRFPGDLTFQLDHTEPPEACHNYNEVARCQ
jgi:hypothetical protein